MGERVSVREYGAHRGCSHTAVRKAVEDGRLSEPAFGRDAEGRLEWIDVELADRQWFENTDPAAAAKAGKTIGAPPAAVGGDTLEELEHEAGELEASGTGEDLVDLAAAGAAGAPSATSPSSTAADYQRARAQREQFAAEEARLNYLRQRGALVSAADVREAAFKRYRSLRDQLLGIPDRLAAILAAERDPVRVHAALTDELKRVLGDSSNDAIAEVTGGTSERVAA